MELRKGRASDAAALAEIEAACFPAAEAAAAEEIAARLKVYANHFYVLWDGARPVAFIDGMTTDEQDLRDEMYADASLHDAQGAWQMIFGLNTLPEYRRRGCAGRLIEALCAAAQEQGRRGVVLTCKEKLVPYYAKFGFADEGVSQSDVLKRRKKTARVRWPGPYSTLRRLRKAQADAMLNGKGGTRKCRIIMLRGAPSADCGRNES